MVFFPFHPWVFFPFHFWVNRNAALQRQSANSRSSNNLQSIQGGMSEDEALAHALARSIQELDESHDRNRRSQQQQQTVPCGGNSGTKDKCLIS